MYVAGCTEVEVKSTEEAFEVFWKGKCDNMCKAVESHMTCEEEKYYFILFLLYFFIYGSALLPP